MIESARFTNVNGLYCDFNTNVIPFKVFNTEVDWRFTERSKSQEDGIYPAESNLGKRLFHCEGDLLANTSAEYWQRRLTMIGALMPHAKMGRKSVGKLEIAFTGINELLTCDACTLDGYPELPIEALSPSAGRYQLSFKSFDPRLYGINQSSTVFYDPNWQNIGGRTYNKTFNKTYSTSGSQQGESIISNSGNYDTYPILTFAGPVSNPGAVLSTSSGNVYVFQLNGVGLADINDTVTIDFKKHTVTRGNGQNLYNFAAGSDWWLLEPAPVINTVRFIGTPVAIPAYMMIQWRNAYMI